MREPGSAEALIRIRGLDKRFGTRIALDALDLDVSAGEFVVLFGPNGAGKTTLVRCLATLSRATAGTVAIGGVDVRRSSPTLRRRLGVVSHSSFLHGALTARENLEFYARMFGVVDPVERAVEVARSVELEGRLDDPVRTFSRGLVQRCSIARALVHDPDVLLFDEPFAGLDPMAADSLREILASAHAGGRTVLMTSHDLGRGLGLADRVLVLRQGRLVLDVPATELDPAELERRYRALSGGADS